MDRTCISVSWLKEHILYHKEFLSNCTEEGTKFLAKVSIAATFPPFCWCSVMELTATHYLKKWLNLETRVIHHCSVPASITKVQLNLLVFLLTITFKNWHHNCNLGESCYKRWFWFPQIPLYYLSLQWLLILNTTLQLPPLESKIIMVLCYKTFKILFHLLIWLQLKSVVWATLHQRQYLS